MPFSVLYDNDRLRVAATKHFTAEATSQINERQELKRPDRSTVGGRTVLDRAIVRVHDVLADPEYSFNRLGEFPAEQPNDLPLSTTAEAFYRSGPTFWQRYTSFWFTSLLNRIVFFVIPVVALMIPLKGPDGFRSNGLPLTKV
jgi:hypothetical protein